MFSNARSLIAAIFLSSVAVGTPTIAGTENWFTFFRELFSLSDYETMLEDQVKLREDLDRKDGSILNRLKAKKKTIDALIARQITFIEAAACFNHFKNADPAYPESIDPAIRNLPEELQSCVNLCQWIKGCKEPSICDSSDFKSFCDMVAEKIVKNENISLPLPPVNLIADSIY